MCIFNVIELTLKYSIFIWWWFDEVFSFEFLYFKHFFSNIFITYFSCTLSSFCQPYSRPFISYLLCKWVNTSYLLAYLEWKEWKFIFHDMHYLHTGWYIHFLCQFYCILKNADFFFIFFLYLSLLFVTTLESNLDCFTEY